MTGLVMAMTMISNLFIPETAFARHAVNTQSPTGTAAQVSGRVITANVVAIDQPIIYNRLGAITPGGMIYALRRDVVNKTTLKTEAEGGILAPGQVMLRPDKRPRPLTLRLNVGDKLQINFQNLLDPEPLLGPPPPPDPEHPGPVGPELLQPATRTTGIHVLGMHLVNSILDDGSNIGDNPSSLVAPGQGITYTLHAHAEGTFLLQNTADAGSGVLSSWNFGLFGAVNVEPAGSEWYRSQLTQVEMALATTANTSDGHPIINYDALYPVGHRYAGQPILNMLSGNEIVHSDLNAIITGPGRGNFPAGQNPPNPAYPNRNQPFREFTQIFHDENEVLQAFPIFEDPAWIETLHSVRDSFGINYGTGGIGAMVIANRLGVGPMWDAVDMKYEESFLSSWVVGDPAMIVDIPANTTDNTSQLITGPKATKALYPDDPSNVYHSYMNDRVKIRNIAVGKEPHIYHLHTHQWLLTPNDDNSNYLDMQLIGTGSGFTYEIAYNGSGNRNKTFGDAIFHCHFYPHFAQGMWGLWRVHDVFEAGTVLDANGLPAAGSRALPDGEIAAGTPIPAIVPLPTLPMAPIPGNATIVPGSTFTPPLPGGQISITEPDSNGDGKPDRNVGFPLFIPAVAGHRAPTPPLDLVNDGGLPRHIIISGNATKVIDLLSFAADFNTIVAKFLPEEGTPAEKAAMDFHAQLRHDTSLPDGTPATGVGGFETNGLPPVPGAPFADPARTDAGAPVANPNSANRVYRAADIQLDLTLDKAGSHFPQSRITTLWGDVQDTLQGTKAPEPFVMRTNSGDIIDFFLTNLIPMRYQQDAFQVLTETDIMGQHMHLVKFDVLSADGSANGYNYEDGALSPEEVRERIRVIKEPGGGAIDLPGGLTIDDLTPQPHPFFGATGPNGENWLGARTNIQRWYADPLVNNSGQERIMGNSFTHDHLGPSTHQQTGLYGSLITEPNGSQWRHPETGNLHGGHEVQPRSIGQGFTDGGPTSWRTDIITREDRGDGPTNNIDKESYREFYFEFADFQLAYMEGRGGTAANPVPDVLGAINPPPVPEAISAADVGTYSVNYRNEPLAFRIFDPATGLQAVGPPGDLSLALSSNITRADPRFNVQPTFYPPLTADVRPGDPFTPMPRAYVNDRVKVRIQVGATEEGHNFSIHGLKWLREYASPNSGWRNSQMMGISEQFILDTVIPPNPQQADTADYLYSANSASEGFWQGIWGILRSYARPRNDLLPLPNNPIGQNGLTIANLGTFTGLAPASAPVRQFDVTAVTAQDALPGGTLVYNSRTNGSFGPLHDPTAVLFVRTEDLDVNGKLKPGVPIEPLVLRAAAGDRILLTLRNRLPSVLPDLPGANLMPPVIVGFNADNITPSSRIGLHPQLVTYDIGSHDGADVGTNPVQSIGPGETKQYQWYAGDIKLVAGNLTATPIEFGAINLSSSDKILHSNKGAIGALIIEPQGSTWVEDADSRASATVTGSDNSSFRDFALVFQDDVNLRSGALGLPNIGGEDDAEDSGQKAVNYRAEPFWFRMGIAPTTPDIGVIANDFTNSLSNSLTGGDPETPVLVATARTPVRLRILKPGGHNRNEAFALNGHVWQREPYINSSTEIGNNPLSEWIGSQEGLGPTNHFDVVPINGAGGEFGVLGDYLFRDMSPSHFTNGAWGILRVVRNVGLGGFSSGTSVSVDQHDALLKTIELRNPEGNVSFTLAGGTTLRHTSGSRVDLLSGNIVASPAPPPQGTFIVRAFQLQPAGVIFNPPVSLNMTYVPQELPSGADQASLRILFWDGTQWQSLASQVDTGTHVVTAQAATSGIFALAGQTPAPPLPPPPVTVITSGGGGSGVIGTTTVSLSGLSSDTSLSVSFLGVTQSASRLRNADGNVRIDIPAGITMRAPGGAPLSSILLTAPTTIPEPPPQNVIVQAYDLVPSGATVDPPIALTVSYIESALPTGTVEKDLVIAYWDGSRWITLPTTVDANANTLTVPVSHFALFAILARAQPPAPVPAPTPVPVPTPAPEPIPVPIPQPAPAPAPPPAPVTEPAPAPTPEPTTPPAAPTPATQSPVNWGIIGGIGVAVIIIGLAVYFVRRVRRA
ncbi:MAG: copper oxidase [Chloroflexi bacterium]|nr:copper oxidase [Chloroflexota bacterium]